ncbi:MAG: heme-binding domain-containing protein [Actinomycetia bacterium]|nr:heme-binding domain-containing protein [Actinomycetes bacterium]
MGITLALAILVIVGAVALGLRRGGWAAVTGEVGRFAGHLALASVAVLGLIQLVPYGRGHANPPVVAEPQWANDETRDLMVRACFGCHSNEVEWPWYSNVAPLSWAVQKHVDDGRDEVNYSEWGQGDQEGDDSVETIVDGEMPPGYYTRFGLHSEADLTDAEVATLVAGLRATPGLDEDGDDD